MLELRNLTYAFAGRPLLASVNLVVESGGRAAVLGLSAAERDAFVRLVAGEAKPQRGSLRLDGRDSAAVRGKSIVNIGVGAPRPRAPKQPFATEVVERFGLVAAPARGKLEDAGQALRLAVALAVTQNPPLILMSAPASLLAGEARKHFLADLPRMLAGCPATILMVTDAADEAMAMGGDIVVLARGSIVQAGPAAEVFSRPVNLTAAVATSWPRLNRVDLEASAGVGRLADGASLRLPDSLPHPAAGSCTLAFRPDDVTLARETANCLRFVVRASGEEMVNGRRFGRVQFADATWLAPLATDAPPSGAVLNAFVDSARLMLFDGEGRALR